MLSIGAFIFVISILFVLRAVLLQFAIQGGFSNSQHARGGQFIAGSFAKGFQDGAPFQFVQGKNFIAIGDPLAGSVMQVTGQIGHFHRGSGAQRDERAMAFSSSRTFPGQS